MSTMPESDDRRTFDEAPDQYDSDAGLVIDGPEAEIAALTLRSSNPARSHPRSKPPSSDPNWRKPVWTDEEYQRGFAICDRVVAAFRDQKARGEA